MKLPRDFSPADPGESNVYAIDFAADLPSGDSIASAQWQVATVQGTDVAPQSHCVGSPAVYGSIVTQRIANLVPGTIYRVQAVATTQAGNVLSLWAHLPCNTLY